MISIYNGNIQALQEIILPIYKYDVTALIGPSGCGKTTLLRCFNRMHDLYPKHRYDGEIIFQGNNILADDVDLINLRSRIGMVFQKPTPFPMSIAENIAYGLRLKGIRNKSELTDRIEQALKHAALWEEVRDKMNASAYDLSGGQQQRLVIARALAVEPEVLLFDEPTSALDPISTAKIEELVVISEEGRHDHHRDAQHAAGRPRVGHDGVPVHGRAHRIRHYGEDFHEPGQEADRRLYYGKVRVEIQGQGARVRGQGKTKRSSVTVPCPLCCLLLDP